MWGSSALEVAVGIKEVDNSFQLYTWVSGSDAAQCMRLRCLKCGAENAVPYLAHYVIVYIHGFGK